MLFNRQPALILGFIGAALTLAIGFGLKLSGEQVSNIMMFSGAAISLIVGVTIRSQVVPLAVADKQIEIAKASDVNTPTETIVKKAKEEV